MGAGANSPTLRYPRQREGTAEIGSLSTHLVNSGSACPMTVAAAASRVIGMDLMSLIVESPGAVGGKGIRFIEAERGRDIQSPSCSTSAPRPAIKDSRRPSPGRYPGRSRAAVGF